MYLRDSQNRLGMLFLADSENPSDHFFLKSPKKFALWGWWLSFELAFELEQLAFRMGDTTGPFSKKNVVLKSAESTP